jgi:hypothetical protein
MKLHGKEITGPQCEVVVLPRGTEEIVIRAQAVLNFDAFEKINPQPKPPEVLYPGGVKSINMEDKGYQQQLGDWAQQRTDWMILKSLESTPGLTWDTVDMADPKTWTNYKTELAATFTPGEMSKIMEAIMTACGLNQAKIEEATKRFLASQAGRP